MKTTTQGRSTILTNNNLFIEETNKEQILYYNSNRLKQWTYLNKVSNGGMFYANWSRIIYKDDDINNVHKFLKSKDIINEN
tara:strand:+ start:315 stop:557 length:243 start_codon:yes stop_codon:yes gene_type:complete